MAEAKTTPELPKTSGLRGCFVGSGSEGLQQPEVCAKILELTRKAAQDVCVCYVGTATYDLPAAKLNQTRKLAEMGCKITDINLSREGNDDAGTAAALNGADVIIISGGNTLYAMDMWRHCGVDVLLRAAAERGCVLSGGSAGAICWFDGGHSDSADPDTYKDAMLREAGTEAEGKDESSVLGTGEAAKAWRYIRVAALGFLPGLVCPHADKVQSNGILRVTDFDQMPLRHRGERGLCIDHFAALCVDGGDYQVLSLPGRPGSVLGDGAFSEARAGAPGVWQKDVGADGAIVTRLVPSVGKLADLVKAADAIVEDPSCVACREQNPI